MTEENEVFREHLCSLVISHTDDAFTLRFIFEQAAWIKDKSIRNGTWLHAIKKGTKVYKTLDIKSKEGRESVADLMYMDQAFKDYADR